jgi:hypothetical protein
MSAATGMTAMLLAAFDEPHCNARPQHALPEIAVAHAALCTSSPAIDAHQSIVVAVFDSIGRSACALLAWIDELEQVGERHDTLGGARLALCAMTQQAGTQIALDDIRRTATTLIDLVEGDQVLVTSTVAVLAGQILSMHADVLYAGTARLGTATRAERLYTLHRLPVGDAGRCRRPANLDWARRIETSDHTGGGALAVLADVAAQSSTRVPRVVLLGGGVDIDNIAAAAEVALTAHARGAAVLYGRAGDEDATVGSALDHALSTYLNACPGAVWPAGSTQASVLDAWAMHRALHTQRRAVDGSAECAAASMIGCVSRQWPVVLVLDGVEWSSPASFDALDHLRHALTGQRVLVAVVPHSTTTHADRDPDDVFTDILGNHANARQHTLASARA